MTVASPLARQYYSCGCSSRLTILNTGQLTDPRHAMRAGSWAVLAVAGKFECACRYRFSEDLQAFGNKPRCRRRDWGGLVGTS